MNCIVYLPCIIVIISSVDVRFFLLCIHFGQYYCIISLVITGSLYQSWLMCCSLLVVYSFCILNSFKKLTLVWRCASIISCYYCYWIIMLICLSIIVDKNILLAWIYSPFRFPYIIVDNCVVMSPKANFTWWVPASSALHTISNPLLLVLTSS